VAIVEDLLNNAYQDTQVLLKNDDLGDVLSVPRDVDFLLLCGEKQKAETVCSFIQDNQYGTATVQESEAGFNVVVVSHMPITQNVICAVSALMCCVAAIFGVEYDGWGSPIQRAA
jgi:hypothetical protein